MPALASQSSTPESVGGRLVSTDGRTLPLHEVKLSADAKAGLARSVLVQTFTNPHAEPLRVTYLLPLPADGAVSDFAFSIGDHRIVGEVDRKAVARERFEQALIEGRSAALVEQERPNLFTQEVGNIPPGATVVCEITVDQKLAWLSEGSWEWRFPTVVAPRYMGEEGRVPDARRILVDVADLPVTTPVSLTLRVRDLLPADARPESPSHPVVSRRGVEWQVELAEERGASLDRDLVVRWKAAQPSVGVALDVGRPSSPSTSASAFGLLTLVPPREVQPTPHTARDVIVLLDTSGSMAGEPLSQARRVVAAVVDSLGDSDQLEMIEFSSSPRRWKRHSVHATAPNRKDAQQWLSKLRAGGGTEMRAGILAALEPLGGEAQRQVIVITDGLIGFESEVVSTVLHKLPAASRVHVVGVGSAVNRGFTAAAARAGRGAELIVGLGEDPERAASNLVAHTEKPVVVDLSISGSALRGVSPARLPDLFAAAPARVSLELEPGGGELLIEGRTADGLYQERVLVPPQGIGTGAAAIGKLFARERVEDLETELAAGSSSGDINLRIEALGLSHQIATRLTTWIAVSPHATVDAGQPTRQERMPHALPFGMSAQGLGLRSAAPGAVGGGNLGGVPLLRQTAAAPRSRGVMSFGAKGRPPMAPPVPAAASVSSKALEVEPADAEAGEGSEPPGEVRGAVAPEMLEEQREMKKESEARAAVTPSRLQGRVLLFTLEELIFTFELEQSEVWDALQSISLRLEDGTTATASLDVTRTTRGGEMSAGVTLRVTVRVALSSQPIAALVFLSGRQVEVALR